MNLVRSLNMVSDWQGVMSNMSNKIKSNQTCAIFTCNLLMGPPFSEILILPFSIRNP